MKKNFIDGYYEQETSPNDVMSGQGEVRTACKKKEENENLQRMEVIKFLHL